MASLGYRVRRFGLFVLVGYTGISLCYLFSNAPELWRATHNFASLLPYLREESMVVLVFALFALSMEQRRQYQESI